MLCCRLAPPLLALLIIAASPAVAADGESIACGSRDEILSHLSKDYAEAPVAMGIATNGTIVEVLSSKAGGSFTIVYTTPAGLTCLMAAGSDWQFIETPSRDTRA